MTKLRAFDPARYLTDDESVASYLAAAAAEEDPDALLSALGDVARARGMTDVAREAGLARQNLYRVLAPGSNPSYLTLHRVMKVLGMSLTVEARTHGVHKTAT